jgi:hypothetical protein
VLDCVHDAFPSGGRGAGRIGERDPAERRAGEFLNPFRLEVARRFAAIQTVAGVAAGDPLPATERARVRTEVAREFFLAAHGREPIDARDLAGQIAGSATAHKVDTDFTGENVRS